MIFNIAEKITMVNYTNPPTYNHFKHLTMILKLYEREIKFEIKKF